MAPGNPTVLWPLVGREAPIAQIADAAADGAGAAVLVGDPGAGKSRILGDAHRVVPGLADLAVERLAPAGPGPWAITRDGDGRGADDRRLVLVDDAHRVDAESAALVGHLARSGRAFVLVGLLRGERAAPELTGLWKDGVGPRIELPGLDLAQTTELLRVVLDGYVEDHTAHDLWRLTRGNPRYLRELVDSGRSTGQLVREEGVWGWRGEVRLGHRLEELVVEQLGQLDDDERQVLELTAVAGQLPLSLLEHLDPDARLLAHLERRGHLVETTTAGGSAISLTNPLVGKVMQSRTPIGLRFAARQLADAAEAQGVDRKEDAYLVARFRLLAGEEPDPAIAAIGAHRAFARAELEVAERMATVAVEGGEVRRGTRVLVDVFTLQDRNLEAEERLAELWAESDGDEDFTDLVVPRAMNLFWGLHRSADALAMLDQAIARVTSPEMSMKLLTAMLSIALVARAPVRPPELDPKQMHAGPVLIQHHVASIPAWLAADDHVRAGRAIDTALRAAQGHREDFPFAEERLHLFRWHWLLLAGELRAAATYAGDQHRRVLGLADRSASTMWTTALTRTLLATGQARSARERLNEAWPSLERHDHFGMVPALLAERALAKLLLGQIPEAAADLAAVDRHVPSAGVWVGTSRATAEAWLLSLQGDDGGARDLLLTEADTFAVLGQRGLEVMALVEAARLGHAPAVGGRLGELLPDIEAPLPRLLATMAVADAHRDLPALRGAAEELERVGALLHAAEAASAAADLATGSEATALQITAHRLAAGCEGAVSPRLRAGPDLASLSGREREIARLAADGRSSRAIADQLVLSRRTVDNHLHRVYRKLGIAGRDGLVPLREALN